jgi:rSAM/selenodomain-associated transferase 2
MQPAPTTTLRPLTKFVCVLVSGVALFLVFRRVDVATLARGLSQAKPGWILAALSIFGGAFLAAAARWHCVLGLAKNRVHALATFRTVLIGHLFNTILFGPTGGDLAKSALYARWYGYDMAAIVSTCVLDRALGAASFFLLALSMPGMALAGGHWHDRITTSVRSPRFWGLAAAGLVLIFVAHTLRRRLRSFNPIRRLLESFVAQTSELLQQPKIAGRGFVFGLLCHICVSCVFLFSLQAVAHQPFSWASVFWIFPVISVITAAPVTFSGAGLREGAALVLLGFYGIAAPDAVAASLLVLFTYLSWAGLAGLILWSHSRKRVRYGPVATPEALSIVIPTLNEALALPETLSRARQLPEVSEIIVVDGGSADQTLAIAEGLGCRTFRGTGGRGGQLRLGAGHATGDVVLLLHADTWLPPNAGQAVLQCLRDCTVAGGGFWKVFREKNLLMAGSRIRCALRILLCKRIMGDQMIFARRAALEAAGGVPAVPLMEEFELCRRLRGQGTLVLAGATVSTSSRRFTQRGVVRTYLRMWHVTLRYYLGARAQDLKELYERD